MRKELDHPAQIREWLEGWSSLITEPAMMVLIGSGAILLHAHLRGSNEPLHSKSHDVDSVTDSEKVAELCYEAIVGSDFEFKHGWHVNIMPNQVLDTLPAGWESRAQKVAFGNLCVVLPSMNDLLKPKLARGEPRDFEHARYALGLNLCEDPAAIERLLASPPKSFAERMLELSTAAKAKKSGV